MAPAAGNLEFWTGLIVFKRGDLEIINYLSDAAGTRNLVIDVSITHDRIGSSKSNPQLNGTLSHPNAPDALLNQAAQRKV